MTLVERSSIHVEPTDASAITAIMEVMGKAFDPHYGEAWNTAQCAAILDSPNVRLLGAQYENRLAGFALTRSVAGEAELLLIAVHPSAQQKGVGRALLDAVIKDCRQQSVTQLFLEVRADNHAVQLYTDHGFRKVGERRDYYRGVTGQCFDAHSYSLEIN